MSTKFPKQILPISGDRFIKPKLKRKVMPFGYEYFVCKNGNTKQMVVISLAQNPTKPLTQETLEKHSKSNQ